MAQIHPYTLYVSTTFIDDPVAHEYSTIQNAIDAIPNYGRYTIKLCSSFMNIPTLILTNDRTQITIDGDNGFGIYFTWGQSIVNIGDRQSLKFRNMTYIRGSEINIDAIGAQIHFYECQSVMAYIHCRGGRYSRVYMHDTKFYGAYGYPAIEINNIDAWVEIFDSYIKGGYTYPAILFTEASSKKFKAKGSTILHGTAGLHPIEISGSFFVDVYIYNCQGTTNIVANPISNLIVNNNNILPDENITF